MNLMLRKLLSILVVFAILFANLFYFLPKTARAQAPAGPWYNQNPVEWYIKVYDEDTSPPQEIFGERYTAAQVNWIIWSIIFWLPTKIVGPDAVACILSSFQGGDVGTCLEAVFASSQTQVGPLATQPSPSILSSIFNDRPLSGITYFKNVFRKLKLVPEAKAQGFGFSGALQPIQKMWIVSRNVAYSLLILAVLILAFMIMFRVKISPQTVITVQSALPKLAVAIVLVTFSYAIAGFMVDLMYIVIGLAALVASSFTPGSFFSPEQAFTFLTTGPTVAGINFGAPGLIILYLLAFVLAALIVFFLSLGPILSAIGLILSIAAIWATIASGLGLLVAGIIIVLLALLIIWHSIKILWMLLKAFVSVILLTIFAPFQIVIGVLVPNFGFGAWLKTMASNMSIFVVTGFLFFLSFLFLGKALELAWNAFAGNAANPGTAILQTLFGTGPTDLFTGDYAGGWPPLFSIGTSDSLVAFLFLGVSLVIFMSIPKTGELIKNLIEGRPFAFGTAIGEALAPIQTAYGLSPVPSYLRGISQRRGEKFAEGFATTITKKVKSPTLRKILTGE